jgi:predicted nuclease of predicted toxin-antitoxin system
MSFFFDQNLSRKLPALLATEFPGCERAFTVGLATSDDLVDWKYAIANRLSIVTKVVDFVSLSAVRGHPPKVVWLRTGKRPTHDVITLFQIRFVELQAFLADPSTALFVLP